MIYIHKEDCLSVRMYVYHYVCLNAFVQFSRYRAETLHNYANDSSGQVVEGLTIPRYLKGLDSKGLITQEHVNNSACIRSTVFKIQR